MTLTHRSIQLADIQSLDRELESLQHAVDAARRNRWHGGDVVGPEFETFLAALTQASPMTYGSDFAPGPEWRGHRNRWREALEDAGDVASSATHH